MPNPRFYFFLFILSLYLLPLFTYAQQLRILTNHLGYEASGPKHAVVQGKTGDDVSAFRVKDSQTDVEAFSGTVAPAGQVQK